MQPPRGRPGSLAVELKRWWQTGQRPDLRNAVTATKTLAAVTVACSGLILLMVVFGPSLSSSPVAAGNQSGAPTFKPPQCRLPSEQDYYVAQLDAVQQLNSPLPRNDIVVTVVQPYSLHRLDLLPIVCQAWRGAVAAAVYAPLLNGKLEALDSPLHGQDLDAAKQAVQRVFDEVKGTCVLDVVLVTEVLPEGWSLDDPEQFYTYPVNSLRNVALGLAQTELVMLIDADFIPAPVALHDQLRQQKELLLGNAHTQQQEGEEQEQGDANVFVLPAFRGTMDWGKAVQFNNTLIKLSHIIGDPRKEAIQLALDSQLVQYFDLLYHGWTQYDKWHTAESPYRIDFPTSSNCNKMPTDYEPYIIARRSQLPAYDERFRGYHFNKQSQMWLLAKLNVSWWVHPTGYVVHLPHMPQPGLKFQGDSKKHHQISYIWMVEMRNTLNMGRTFYPVARNHEYVDTPPALRCVDMNFTAPERGHPEKGLC